MRQIGPGSSGAKRANGTDMPTGRNQKRSAGKTHGEQVAALPWRNAKNGIKIALVTSRTTRRWIIPKGWREADKPDRKMAEIEALQEAGLEGKISSETIGLYFYDKILDDGSALPCRVDVYGLDVRTQHRHFKEARERQVEWFTPEEAADEVDEDELAILILHYAGRLTKTGT